MRDPARADTVADTDRPSVRDVFRREAAFVMRTIRRLGVWDADVEDVAQEVFIVLHRRMPEYDTRTPMRRWLFGIARRVVADHRCLARVRRERPSASVLRLSTPPDQHRALDRAHARMLLDGALDTLSDPQREVFVLYELESMPMSEVVAAVDCPLQTAYSRLHAAREAVRRYVLRREGPR